MLGHLLLLILLKVLDILWRFGEGGENTGQDTASAFWGPLSSRAGLPKSHLWPCHGGYLGSGGGTLRSKSCYSSILDNKCRSLCRMSPIHTTFSNELKQCGSEPVHTSLLSTGHFTSMRAAYYWYKLLSAGAVSLCLSVPCCFYWKFRSIIFLFRGGLPLTVFAISVETWLGRPARQWLLHSRLHIYGAWSCICWGQCFRRRTRAASVCGIYRLILRLDPTSSGRNPMALLSFP